MNKAWIIVDRFDRHSASYQKYTLSAKVLRPMSFLNIKTVLELYLNCYQQEKAKTVPGNTPHAACKRSP